MTEPILIHDSREQRGYSDLFESRCIVDTLAVGDYSVAGLIHLVAVERKSLSDLLQSLTHERDRFERELAKARAVWESICCFSIRYVPFIFAGDRLSGARLTESLLLKFAREYRVTVQRMDDATRRIGIAGNPQSVRKECDMSRYG